MPPGTLALGARSYEPAAGGDLHLRPDRRLVSAPTTATSVPLDHVTSLDQSC
jgi:hypothetical protein